MTARILIIAGSDSGGGAGIQADIKTVTMLGGHAMTAVTAVTAQNTLGVTAVHAIPTEMVIAQIDAVISDIGVDAVKIGMIGSATTAHAVADRLEALDVPIIFDPVMVATSGAPLADAATIKAFAGLIQIATIVTPNLPELAVLGGRDAITHWPCAVLEKGGHGDGDMIVDHLFMPGKTVQWTAPRIDTSSTHGTGCTLASAIATGLGQGMSIADAASRAHVFVRLALLNAPGLGGGNGPMGHQAVRNDALTLGPSLNQVTVGARDYAASIAFYKMLGLRQIVDSPDNGYARFEADNGATFSVQVDGTPPGATVYFESLRLDAWVAELVTKGLVFDQMPRDEDWLWREARLRDPHGNVICLYQAGENRRFPPWRI
jgi:hydroxymethylpyrimidine/phosphomethylpyrimidine kinase